MKPNTLETGYMSEAPIMSNKLNIVLPDLWKKKAKQKKEKSNKGEG